MPNRLPARRNRHDAPPSRPSLHDYQTLAAFRHLLRRFLAFSEASARRAGLTPQHHQALLAIKGFQGGEHMTIHDLADQLCIRHHSAVELVDRLAASSLVVRRHDPADRRRVLLELTAAAERGLADLSATHLAELQRLRPTLVEILHLLGETATEPAPKLRGSDAHEHLPAGKWPAVAQET